MTCNYLFLETVDKQDHYSNDFTVSESKMCSLLILLLLAIVQPCLADWTGWTPWTPCTKTCGIGRQQRNRFCPGLEYCPGVTQQEQICNPQACIIGQWQSWQPWTICSRTCGTGGTKIRTRVCLNSLLNACAGPKNEQIPCVVKVDCRSGLGWALWGLWSGCSQSCSGGVQTRTRGCLVEGGGNCVGQHDEQKICNVRPCNGWTEWVWATNNCLPLCGPGLRKRIRTCVGARANCVGGAIQDIPCANSC